MTERQKRFVSIYVKCLNASESCRQAGYKTRNVNVTASQLLANPNVKAEVDKQLALYNADISSKDGFIRKIKSLAEQSKHPSVQARYYELIAKCKGYVEPDTKQHISIFNSNSTLKDMIAKRIPQHTDAQQHTTTSDNKCYVKYDLISPKAEGGSTPPATGSL